MGGWAKAKVVLTFCCDHIAAVAVFCASALAFVFAHRSRITPAERLAVELDAIDAKRQVAMVAAAKGAEAAHAKVAQQYADARAALTSQQRTQAATLAAHPEQLAAFIVRAVAAPPDPGPGPSQS